MSLLQVLEAPFESRKVDTACAVFTAWQALAQNFALAGQLSNIRRVKLLVKPLFHALLLHPEPDVHKVCCLSSCSAACSGMLVPFPPQREALKVAPVCTCLRVHA